MNTSNHWFDALGLSITQRLGPASSGRVLLLTSARPGEGKSFVAHRLATALAGGSERRLALVDANPESPALGAAFAPTSDADFFACLAGEKQAPEAMQPTTVEGLFAWPSARSDANAALLYRSEAIARVLDGLRDAFDLTILDGGALPAVGALALQADATIVVVDASRTRRDVVAGALDSPHVDRRKVLGAVLNRRPEHVPPWLYRIAL